MAQVVYPQDIPSILDKHPNIPAQFVQVLHLNKSIVSGTAVSNDNVRQAEAAAESLRSLHHDHAAISEEIVETAINRSAIVRATHAELQYGQGMGAVLAMLTNLTETVDRLNTKVDQLDARFDELNGEVVQLKRNGERVAAIATNSHIVRQNSSRRADDRFVWRQKEVAGSGEDLVAALYGARNPLVAQDIQELGAAALGSVPDPNHTPNLHGSSTHREIARMMLFYNEDFGITATDQIDIRRSRLAFWLGGH